MNKSEFLKYANISEKQFCGIEEIPGSLGLSSLTSIPEGFNPTLGGSLYLSSLTSIPEGFNPTVGGSLGLSSLTSIPEGFNPTVGGSLDLSSLTSIPEGFNPTVGGSLDLSSLTSYIDKTKYSMPESVFEKNGKKYIYSDGILSEVTWNHGNVYHILEIGKTQEMYLVTDGNGKWSHGETLKSAREDLIYKISDRDTSRYDDLTVDSVLRFEDAIECYRVISGSCDTGTKGFVESRNLERRSYSISEIIQLTNGAYGSDSFKNFFTGGTKCKTN